MGDLLIPLNAEKVPLISWRLRRSGTTPPMSEDRINRLNRNRMAVYPDAAMWARMIPEGVVVLDLDDGFPAPSSWPVTRTRRTPRGYHYAGSP